jgi:hypothetical protein
MYVNQSVMIYIHTTKKADFTNLLIHKKLFGYFFIQKPLNFWQKYVFF